MKEFEDALRGAYALLMLVIAWEILKLHTPPPEISDDATEDPDGGANGSARPIREVTDRTGRTYRYRQPRQGKGAAATGIGGFLTGLLGVGIGEVVMPQLVKRNHVPVPVAAATSCSS